MKWFLVAITAVAMAMGMLAASGCGKRSGDEGAVEETAWADQTVTEALDLLESGDFTAALARADQGFAQASGGDRVRLFGFSLSLLLNDGRIEEAQSRFLAALASKTDAEAAKGSFGYIEEYLAQQEDGHEQVLAWCDRLDAAPLTPESRALVVRNRMTALLTLKRFDAALDLLGGAVWTLPDDDAAGLFGWMIATALTEGRPAEAEQAIDLAETRGASRPALVRTAASARIDLALARQQFAEAGVLMEARAGLFDDGALAGLLDKIARAALAAGATEAGDAFLERALALYADRPPVRARAARWYLVRARDMGDLALAVARLEKMNGMGVAPAVLANGVGLVSPLVLAPDTPDDAVRGAMDFALALKKRVEVETDRAQLAGVLLDAGFRTESYGMLVGLLEDGIPGHDAAWHATMINKIKAHDALNKGQTDEAVRRFRAFMEAIASQEDAGHRDPVTDERVTKPMILGFNARRIGDILEKAGRPDEAAQARAEARRHYEKALEEFATGDPERKTVNDILAELAAR